MGVRRNTNAAIDALANPVLDQTDLHSDVDKQRKRLTFGSDQIGSEDRAAIQSNSQRSP